MKATKAVAALASLGWSLVPGAARAQVNDRVEVSVDARVASSLAHLTFVASYKWTPGRDREELVLDRVADRACAIREPLGPAAEFQLFPAGYDRGGFDRLEVTVEGRPCRRAPTGGEPVVRCRGRFAAGRPVSVRVSGRLAVPERFGPFGLHKRQLTLLGGWFPAIGRADDPPPVGRVEAAVYVPDGHAVVLGRTYAPHVPAGRSGVEVEASGEGVSMPLVVLPARTGSRGIAGGAVRWISGRRYTDDSTALRQAELTVGTLAAALELLEREGLPAPTRNRPLLVVEAPLRRNLARAATGVVLVSDRAFRVPPFERFFRFHRYPIVRELLTAWALDFVQRGAYRHVAADAVGGFLRDRFVAVEAGYAEDLFDVLSFWSFVPAVNSLLYAPQAAFTGAYFRVVDETDRHRVNLVDPPSAWPRGRILYEKLLDRAKARATAAAMHRVAIGGDLVAAFGDALGADEVEPFLNTWLRPYPDVQYGLRSWRSEPIDGAACRPNETCHRAEIEVFRTGEVIREPLQLRLTDDDDDERIVWTDTSTAALRTVTATLGAALDLVELDPWGRTAETPSASVPSPLYDNRSRPEWRVLLNSFNFVASPTGGNLDTAIDLTFSQVREVRWRFGLTAAFGPDAVSLVGRTVRRFGQRVTPDVLGQWVGVAVGGDWLRSEFAGETDSNYALTGQLFYGYDDRQTPWAPEAGVGLRAGLAYNHVFGRLSALDADGEAVTREAVSLTLRGLRSWRIDGRHQLSVRGSLGGFIVGRPQSQLLYFLGGRTAVRGYVVDADVGRYRAIGSGEWVHTLLADLDENVVELWWATKLDGALFADVAAIADDLDGSLARALRADVGYGFRIYLDQFGVRPGVMAVDVAVPLLDLQGRFKVGAPEVYIDFTQSFFSF